MRASVIIRTYNEERYLQELLAESNAQSGLDRSDYEVIVVDSGSTDRTLEIAEPAADRIVHIEKRDFSFGRSLNVGCDAASGDVLVFISGHCVPTRDKWLSVLIEPIEQGICSYTYGRQIGRDTTKFSEDQLFAKFYPVTSQVPQAGFFVNNANAALSREAWLTHRFDEELTGLEDMDLGRRLKLAGHEIGYVADAEVYHIHDESWARLTTRYEREARALNHIMPEIRFGITDFVYYTVTSIMHDLHARKGFSRRHGTIGSILGFRTAQYWGTYVGHHEHRKLSASKKHNYFYAK